MAYRFSWHTIRSMNQILQQPQEFQELDLAVRLQLPVLVTPKAVLVQVQVLLSALEE